MRQLRLQISIICFFLIVFSFGLSCSKEKENPIVPNPTRCYPIEIIDSTNSWHHYAWYFFYNSNNQIESDSFASVDGPFEGVSTFIYNQQGLIVEVRDRYSDIPGNWSTSTMTFHYNSLGLIDSIKQGAIVSSLEYDSQNRLIKQIKYSGASPDRVLKYTYDSNGNRNTCVYMNNTPSPLGPDSVVTTLQFDNKQNPFQNLDPALFTTVDGSRYFNVIEHPQFDVYSTNNILEIKQTAYYSFTSPNNSTVTYSYEYDNLGYPTVLYRFAGDPKPLTFKYNCP